MSKFSKISFGAEPRTEFKESLGLSGCEISYNALPAGASAPFYHAHKQNEEVYIILEGDGEMELDGQKVALNTNDALRVSPSVMRKISAKTDLRFLCIQAKENSLTQWTQTDGILDE